MKILKLIGPFLLKHKLGIAMVLMLIIFSRNTFSLNQVKGNSMYPTLNENDWVLSRRLFTGLDSEIEVGSIISFHPPGQKKLLAVKRVVAVSGDTLEIKEGLVYVNGQVLNEPYLESGHSTQPQHTFPNKSYWEVPEGHVFVLGDNRKLAASNDSRNFGCIAIKDVKELLLGY